MTSDDLHLEIDVEDAGWLKATIYEGVIELRMRASYMGDALGDLASAVVAIAGETAQLRTRSILWAREPDYWRFDFTREGNHVAVAIVDVTEDEARPNGFGFGGPGRVRLSVQVPRRDLIAAVSSAFDGVLATGGLGRYDREWMSYRFPFVAYTRLREMVLREGAGTEMLDPKLPEFHAAVDAIISQLGVVMDDDRPWHIIPAPPGYVGVSVNGGEIWASATSLGHAVVDIADKLQDGEIDFQWRALPDCLPGHPHPPRAILYDEGPMWECPQTASVVRPIIPDWPTT